jgi:molecular chaperone HtpG
MAYLLSVAHAKTLNKEIKIMEKKQGKIGVTTENIFPIIKKFLYSDHEIFLRELISNAVDATQKLKALASMGQYKEELGDLTIKVEVDKKKKLLKVIDRGIGMTADEVEKYITQIAFSSAEEFIEKFKNISEEDRNSIIGRFGLGFYSSFMVSKKVEINTKSYNPDAEPVHWECDGSPEYTIEKGKKSDRGTEIILHIDEENKHFLEDYKIEELLNKYCKFLPIPIQFGFEEVEEEIEGKKDKDGKPKTKKVKRPKIINNTDPLWKKNPSDLNDEDYKKFYRELYPYTFEEPLFHIHLNVDYPFNLTGILYFPKVKKDYELQRNKIQLYSNQVFITDSVEGIVPEFLTLLHGVIDSPDIPLNVSRSYLQSDNNVKKISNYITRKVADKLQEIFNKDREKFEEKWDDIKIFIEYGMISEPKFWDKAVKFALLKNVDDKYFTFDEYKQHIEKTQKDKDGTLIYLYATNKEEQFSYIESAKERGYDVLLMDGVLDNHFINTLEQKFEKSRFARVDSDTIEKLINKEEKLPSKLDEKQKEELKKDFERNIDTKQFEVVFEDLSETDTPVIITQNEFMRRMKDMEAVGGTGMMGLGSLPDTYNLVVNTNHPLVSKIIEIKEEKEKDEVIKQLYDLARLSKNLLKGKELSDFVKRSVEIIN